MQAALTEAARRADVQRGALAESAAELAAAERQTLAVWQSEEFRRLEHMVFGDAAQISFEQERAFSERRIALETEAERRRATLRDRTHVRVAAVEPLGGRLLVGAPQ